METFRGPFDQVPCLTGRRAVTLGTFDGVHRGHQAILGQLLRIAQAPGMDGAAVVTFGRHPRAVLTPRESPRLLTTEEEMLRLFDAADVPAVVILEFDDRLAQLEYDAFVRRVLLERLGLAHFVLGHEVHFGRNRGGTYATVADLAESAGFAISQVASVRHEGEPISSSRIRAAIQAGRLADATAMLGHPYLIRGRVVEGRGDGRRLGFPTANLDVGRPEKLLPPPGVYACWARTARPLGDTRTPWSDAVLNLGRAPTMTDGSVLGLEVHLLDGAPDLRGQTLEVALAAPIREEIRFPDASALAARIRHDVAEARRRLGEAPGPQRPERLDRLE
jgi:riboflavin kinase/FMN adenylyltransferase